MATVETKASGPMSPIQDDILAMQTMVPLRKTTLVMICQRRLLQVRPFLRLRSVDLTIRKAICRDQRIERGGNGRAAG